MPRGRRVSDAFGLRRRSGLRRAFATAWQWGFWRARCGFFCATGVGRDRRFSGAADRRVNYRRALSWVLRSRRLHTRGPAHPIWRLGRIGNGDLLRSGGAQSLVWLAFAGACVLASIYGFLQGAWPFGVVEAIWAVVAVWRWRAKARGLREKSGTRE